MRIQVYKQAHMNLKTGECRDANKGTWTWGYEDVGMWGYKHVHMHIRIGGCEDERIQATAQEPKDMRMRGYKQVKHIKHVDCF